MTHISPKMIVNSFNHQFTTSKLGKHSSLRKICQVSKDVKRMSLEESRAVGVAALYNDSFKSCRLSLEDLISHHDSKAR